MKSIQGASEGTGLKQHVWDSHWLNHSPGERSCKVCGCQEITGQEVRADVKGLGRYIYRDVLGNKIRSYKPLSCPVFVGDAASATAKIKEDAREARASLEEMRGRVTQLEQENLSLREALDSVRQIDVMALAKALLELSGRDRVTQLPLEIQGAIEAVAVETIALPGEEEDQALLPRVR